MRVRKGGCFFWSFINEICDFLLYLGIDLFIIYVFLCCGGKYEDDDKLIFKFFVVLKCVSLCNFDMFLN